MLKNVLIGAILLPFMATTSLAQSQSGDHHYQGGPKTDVPHHIGPKPAGTTPTREGTTSQAGQHHYQGGPTSAVPHHVGDQPKVKQREKAKKKKSSQL